MKALIGLLSFCASLNASASEVADDPTIVMSCSGITYRKTIAVQLVVMESADKTLRAEIRTTNGETDSIPLKAEPGWLGSADPKKLFHIYLREDGVENQVMVNWDSDALNMQFSHITMICAHPQF